jgi:small subunit ribosomal protein S6
MAAEKPIYDLVLLLDTVATDDVRAKLVSDTRKSIESDGELVGYHEWGVRALAYPIERRADAEYHLFQFRPGSAELLESLARTLHIADGVLRHRIIKLESGTPPPPQIRPEPRAAAAAPAAAAPAAEPAPAPAPASA